MNTNETFFSDVGVCDRPYCQNLQRRIDGITPHSCIKEKRSQRNEIIKHIAIAVEDRRKRDGSKVNIWLFDDLLPNPDGSVTSMVIDILVRFGPDRVRIFSPNLKQSIVDHYRSLNLPSGTVISGCGCVCRFQERWRETMVQCGGLDVVMIDGYANFENGVRGILVDLVDGKAFNPTAGQDGRPPVCMNVVISDRGDRAHRLTVGEVIGRRLLSKHQLFFINIGDCSQCNCHGRFNTAIID